MSIVKISSSNKRNPIPQSYNFDDGYIMTTTWGTIKVNNSHFFPSSFQIKRSKKVLYIDPVEVESSEKADYILLTHSHPDHFSIKDLEKLVKPETIIICPKCVANKLLKLNNKIEIVKPRDVIKLGDIICEATYAYNIKPIFLWIKAHPKSKENVGYILTFPKDIRIYHAGDTGIIPEMSDVKNIDIAMIPIGGNNLTMNVNEAAQMVNEVRPGIVIPMHYETGKRNDLNRFKSLVDHSIKVEVLE